MLVKGIIKSTDAYWALPEDDSPVQMLFFCSLHVKTLVKTGRNAQRLVPAQNWNQMFPKLKPLFSLETSRKRETETKSYNHDCGLCSEEGKGCYPTLYIGSLQDVHRNSFRESLQVTCASGHSKVNCESIVAGMASLMPMRHAERSCHSRLALTLLLSPILMALLSRMKRAHKLKENPRDTGRVSLGHLAGQTAVYWPVFQGFPAICFRITDRKGHFCRDTGRVSHPGGFRNFMWSFLMFLFCSLTICRMRYKHMDWMLTIETSSGFQHWAFGRIQKGKAQKRPLCWRHSGGGVLKGQRHNAILFWNRIRIRLFILRHVGACCKELWRDSGQECSPDAGPTMRRIQPPFCLALSSERLAMLGCASHLLKPFETASDRAKFCPAIEVGELPGRTDYTRILRFKNKSYLKEWVAKE